MITIGELRGELRLLPDQDDRLESIRQEVIDLWEQMTGFLWNQRTGHVEVIEPRGRQNEIRLGLWPVSTITSIEERWDGDTTWSTLSASGYFLHGRRSVRLVSGFFAPLLRVTYSGGTASADADVKRALITQARFMIDRLGAEKLITRNTFGPQGGATLEEATLAPLFRDLALRKARKA